MGSRWRLKYVDAQDKTIIPSVTIVDVHEREDAMMLVLTMAYRSNPSVRRCTSNTKTMKLFSERRFFQLHDSAELQVFAKRKP
jgi:hypothetical protein